MTSKQPTTPANSRPPVKTQASTRNSPPTSPISSSSPTRAITKTAAFQKHLISWSLFWGGLLTIGFYGALHNGLITNPTVVQYCAAHPIEYVIVGMFFVGLAFLGVKYFDLHAQAHSLRKGNLLPPRNRRKETRDDAGIYLAMQEEIQGKTRGSTYHRARLIAALRFLRDGGDPDLLDMELRYLADDDVGAADSEYGFVRTILWAVPMLGFLGTVVGITVALSNLDLNAINESSKALSAGLSIAFDTTALGIGLDLVLYFFQFMTYRREMGLLREVDRRIEEELRGRFEVEEERLTGNTGEVVAVRKMLEKLVESLERLTHSQTDLWSRALDLIHERYAAIASESANLVRTSLAEAIDATTAKHTQAVARLEQRLHQSVREETLHFNDGLRANVDALTELQQAVTRNAEAAHSAVDASTQLSALEDRLNANLASLARVGNFEQTVNSLAAAIHLLNAKYALNMPESLAPFPSSKQPPKRSTRQTPDEREDDSDKGQSPDKGYAA